MPENPMLLLLRGFTNLKQPLVQISVPIGDTSTLVEQGLWEGI